MPDDLCRLVADRGETGRRLDLVLNRRLAGLRGTSRTRVQRWIEEGRVAVNGRTIRRAAARLTTGDCVTVELPESTRRKPVAPEEVPLDILYEDDLLIAVNKPSGTVVHPTYRHESGTLLNALLWHARAWPDDQRPKLLGRLDRLTSGVVLVARTTSGHAALRRALRAGAKEYLALVHGRPRLRGTIDFALARDPGDRRRVVASPDAGSPSLTLFERLATVRSPAGHLSLLLCRLVTGRMHQIRVHLAASGWPLVGDPTYGAPRESRAAHSALAASLGAFPRQALHSWRVAFAHPLDGRAVRIVAPPPADLRELLSVTGLAHQASTR